MRSILSLVATLFAIGPMVASAGPTIFANDEAGFDAQVSTQSLGLAGTENWESSTQAPATLVFASDPIQPGVANGPFPGGTNVATGMWVQSNTNIDGGSSILPRGIDALVATSPGYVGTPSHQLSTNVGTDSLDLIFNPGAMAVALTPLYIDSTDGSALGSITIRVFDTTNSEIGPAGGTTINGVDYQAAASFFGIVAMAGQPIGRINIFHGEASNTSFSGADDIDVYQPAGPTVARLGDRVWEDENANGIQDCEDSNTNGIIGDLGDIGPECDSGIPNLPVYALDPGFDGVCNNGDDFLLLSTMTDIDGFYGFDDLTPGTYCVQFTLPSGDFCSTDGFELGSPRFTARNQGGDDSVDSDADSATGVSSSISLAGGNTDLTVDAGIVCPAKVGNRVWLDDGNGVQDANEPGIDGVNVNLFACGPDGMAGTGDDIDMMQSRTTGASGNYMFGAEPGVFDLQPGNYYVQFEQLNGLEFTAPKHGGDDSVDSDCLAPNGVSACTGNLGSRGINLNRDCGLVAPPLQCDLILDKTCAVGDSVPGAPFPTADVCSFSGASANVTYGYTVTNSGSSLTGVVVTDDLLGVIGGPVDLGTGDSAQFTVSTTISGTTTNVATVQGFLADGSSCPAMDSLTIEQVDNEGPVTTTTTAVPNPVAIGSNVDLTANVDDTNTGGSNIESAEYSMDGRATWLVVDPTDGSFGEVSEDVNVSFNAPDVADIYDLCVRGTDDPGNLGDPECILLVVYDPSAGFVTGGGWIDSPAGAYIANNTLSGKANFGFVSKYKKGAKVPVGNTEFQFKTGDLNFHSSSYEFLVITMGGTNAQFKGSGTINGSPAPNGTEFKFMLWANDGIPDTFRIRIWYEDNGIEMGVYDNGFDQEIGGGSIVIHTKKK